MWKGGSEPLALTPNPGNPGDPLDLGMNSKPTIPIEAVLNEIVSTHPLTTPSPSNTSGTAVCVLLTLCFLVFPAVLHGVLVLCCIVVCFVDVMCCGVAYSFAVL